MGFAHPDDHFGGLAADQTAQIFESASDIALVVDSDGVIRDMAFGSNAAADLEAGEWTGRKLRETVTIESEPKIEQILEYARSGQQSRPREINHTLPDGTGVPVRYSAMSLNDNGKVVVFGRDISQISVLQQKLMNSQLAIEREFGKLRSSENRYRLIFQLGGVPQIVVDAASLRVSDINTPALKLLGRKRQRVENMRVVNLFDTDNSDLLHQLLRATIDDEFDEDVKITLRSGEAITINATQFRQERKNYLLLRLSSDSGNVVAFASAADRKILDIVNVMPDAFVVTNSARQVIAANNAFVDLLNLSGPTDAVGEMFDTWFDRPNVDCNVLMANIREHGSVNRFATVLRSSYDQLETVEIAAVQVDLHDGPIFGFTIRPSSAALAVAEQNDTVVGRSNEQITNLVGHMPLKDIVRDTTEMIEKLCIETALELTKENRALAAQMLGLSRQSLYAKLGKTKSED